MFRQKFIKAVSAIVLVIISYFGFIATDTSLYGSEVTSYCGVDQTEIINFVEDEGYLVEDVQSYEGCDVLVRTSEDNLLIVAVNDGGILTVEELR